MIAPGFRIARDARGGKCRGYVPKAKFVQSGTIWERRVEPIDAHAAKVAAIMEDIMDRSRNTLAELAKRSISHRGSSPNG